MRPAASALYRLKSATLPLRLPVSVPPASGRYFFRQSSTYFRVAITMLGSIFSVTFPLEPTATRARITVVTPLPSASTGLTISGNEP